MRFDGQEQFTLIYLATRDFYIYLTTALRRTSSGCGFPRTL
jgi:hypothetical protein